MKQLHDKIIKGICTMLSASYFLHRNFCNMLLHYAWSASCLARIMPGPHHAWPAPYLARIMPGLHHALDALPNDYLPIRVICTTFCRHHAWSASCYRTIF